MHRLAATPGGWNPQAEGVIILKQNPAPLVCLTAADTDIQTLAAALPKLPNSLRCLRVANLLHLQQQITVDTYAEEVLAFAKVIILRLLGGRSYWSYGLEVVQNTVQQTGAELIVLPGDDRPDPDLISQSTISLSNVNHLWRYFTEGGVENFVNALKFVGDVCLGHTHNPPPPQLVPRVGLYSGKKEINNDNFPKVGILFYRAHYLSGNTAPIDALCEALQRRYLTPVPVFVSSPRDREIQAEVSQYFQPINDKPIQILLNTTSFAIKNEKLKINSKLDNIKDEEFIFNCDVPVLQVICSSNTAEQWLSNFTGLSPRDLAMNVALPEIDGRIITRAISFKAVQTWQDELETDVVIYEPIADRIEFVADLAANWIILRQTPPEKRRIALILANYPCRDGRLANGVGLDTPASCIEILKALQQAGYLLENIPTTTEELITLLTTGITNDPEAQYLRSVRQFLSAKEYQKYFSSLPIEVQQAIGDRWQYPPENLPENLAENPQIPISGISLGNIFVGIQPSRGYDIDPSLNYHAPDLEPTHNYLAFYYWLRQHFQAHAIVHIGKHGNLEWLPGKSVALSQVCYPEIALGAMPHFYPFIVNDPGEGSQAKRRAQAVIIDHLTPPMTRAELYGPLQQLETLIDEYYEAQNLDPSRLTIIKERIYQLVLQENIEKDLGIENNSAIIINSLDTYLCELKEAQIRDGLHIFGKCPEGRQLRDLIISIARHPGQNRLGLTRALAKDKGLDFDPLTSTNNLVAELENQAAELVENIINNNNKLLNLNLPYTQLELTWIKDYLFPALQQTTAEITNLLRGLDGRFVPSGPAGAPTRGRPDVLPTGVNFYSVDIRALPTETAWMVGKKAAEALIERYTQENGEYPKTLGLSVWGTSTMRTGGDDIAEALALLGVQPVWDGPSRRVVDFEIVPISVLGRPRVDVTLRISGFFRDAFSNLIDLFDAAVQAVAELSETPEDNPLANQVKKEIEIWSNLGLSKSEAKMRSRYRIFGSKPGAYGAGLQGLIEAQNWHDDADLARAYINWSSYAYTRNNLGKSAPEAFQQRLQEMQIVLHNQDNREHDLLDSDDYYQFQGGLTVAVRAITGKNPVTYFGDNSMPENPKVRHLREEIARVYRARVVNPKWIDGVMRHGYKGAFEMAATIDYLFAYNATAHCVEDFMYVGVANAFIFDNKVQDFIREKNPWALRDMAERLLEAHQRGLWQTVDKNMLESLRAIVHEAEAVIEGAIG